MRGTTLVMEGIEISLNVMHAFTNSLVRLLCEPFAICSAVIANRLLA
jgi:hypothetical protein